MAQSLRPPREVNQMFDKKYILAIINVVLSVVIILGLVFVLLSIRNLQPKCSTIRFIAEAPAMTGPVVATKAATLKPVFKVFKASISAVKVK